MSTDQRSIDWYNNNASNYTKHIRDDAIYHHLYEKPAIYSMLPDLNGKEVLSLGCGSGEDCNYLKLKGAQKVIGIDISEKLIKIATNSYPKCKFQTMDMEKIHFKDESFDLVFSSLALHYIENWTKVLEKVYKVLKPDSYFIFSCNHPIYNSMKETENNDTTKIQQLARIKNKENNEVKIIGDYLNRRKMSVTGDLAVTTWHKPIGEISKEINKAGFLIDKILDPKPLEKMKSFSPSDYKTLVKIPFFIIFRLYKK
jgi:ubiquinone/menaquinone biosynthesis C-methylase UbiE